MELSSQREEQQKKVLVVFQFHTVKKCDGVCHHMSGFYLERYWSLEKLPETNATSAIIRRKRCTSGEAVILGAKIFSIQHISNSN